MRIIGFTLYQHRKRKVPQNLLHDQSTAVTSIRVTRSCLHSGGPVKWCGFTLDQPERKKKIWGLFRWLRPGNTSPSFPMHPEVQNNWQWCLMYLADSTGHRQRIVTETIHSQNQQAYKPSRIVTGQVTPLLSAPNCCHPIDTAIYTNPDGVTCELASQDVD